MGFLGVEKAPFEGVVAFEILEDLGLHRKFLLVGLQDAMLLEQAPIGQELDPLEQLGEQEIDQSDGGTD